ncbi:TraR/DksA family transcriptional regulator [Streptomyces sp.]|uniref:TraR/DksA family transcriptional regulator n=1 Tax=Streptomyces sp. TaxID=1931 RepID=UPI002F42B97F
MSTAEQAMTVPEASGEAAGRKAAAKKAAAKKSAAKKAPVKKSAARKAPVKKAATKKTAAGKAPVREAAAKKAPARKTSPGKAAAAGTAEQVGAGRAVGADETGVGEVEAEKTDVAVPAARTATEPGELAVLPGEEPWTDEEVAEARAELLAEVERLKAEIASSEAAVAGLMRDSGDGAGDEADTGTKNITREYEMALAANARETLTQATHALQRLDEGTYGLCEVCGKTIGKARMQAFPRATLCLDDKQRQERR